MKKFVNIFTVLIMAAVILTLYFSYNILKYPYIGGMVQVENENVEIILTEPMTWSDRNLEVGEKILSVNGKSPLNHQVIKQWNLLEKADELEVEKLDGSIVSYDVDHELDTQMIFQFLIPLIVTILCIYCSYLIYKSYLKSENSRQSAITLIIFLFTFSLSYMGAGASARGDYFSRLVIHQSLIITPVTYLHFIYRYYKELNAKWFSYKWLIFLYSLAIINLLIYINKDFLGADGVVVKNSSLLFFLIASITVATLIIIGIKKISYKTQKYMIKVLLIANAFAFVPFIVLYAIPFVVFKVEVFSPVFLTGFLLIIPFALVYQFLATKIYDIEFILGRIKYYSLIITIPSILGAILLISIKSGNPTVFSIRTFIMLFLLLFTTLYLKEVLDFKFKLNRFSEKSNYQDRLTKYTEEIRIARNIYEVTTILKQTIIDTTLIENAYLIELDKKSGEVSDSFKHKGWILDEYTEIIRTIKNKIGSIEELDNGFMLNMGEANGKTFIVLALSDINTPILTRDERQWLNSLAYYTNVTLENFVKIEHLMDNLEELESNPMWLNKIVFSLEEKQRSELAKDLHDSVLQDLISQKKHVELLYESYKNMNEDVLDVEVKKLLDNMNNSISTTRKTCHELRPQLLYDLGLDKALKKLVNEYQYTRNNTTVTTRNLDQTIKEDVQLNIYRIAQELLNNARKHSHADSIRLVVVKIKEKLVLHYEDDGVGEDLEFIENKEGSMGLSGIKERVRVLGGTIKIETEPGKGFKVIVEV